MTQARCHQLMKQMREELHYTCTFEWVEACVDWVDSEFGKGDITRVNDFYMEHLKLQWADADLKHMESKCLPPKLIDTKLVTLPGTYGLQINSVQDIGESAYSQYNKIKKLENENTNVAATDTTEFIPSWQPKPRRCLYLTVTDGTQTVFGMEIEHISSLSLHGIKPGSKILVKGPVDCRKGVLHLKPQHVEVIGGIVDDLVEPNKVENVLAQILDIENRQ